MSAPVRVLVVDDQALVREGIASLLSVQDGVEVVGTAEGGAQALALARELRPEVVLMDVRMPGMDGIEATRRLRREVPEAQVVMLTTFDDEAYVRGALEAGAVGYILKSIPSADLADVVRGARRGRYQLDPAVGARLAQPISPAGPKPALDLTSREQEVLRALAAGATNREIAAALGVGEGTVKNHVSNILSRLGLRDRTQAAVYAAERGLLDGP